MTFHDQFGLFCNYETNWEIEDAINLLNLFHLRIIRMNEKY